MAANVNKWSETPASNATADPAINWAEGQAPSTVNDSARQMMAAIAADRDDTRGALTFAGTAAAWTLTTNSGNATYQNGLRVSGRVANVNAVNATLNVDGVAAKNVYVLGGSGYAQIPAGRTIAGQHVAFQYDASLNSAAGGWILQEGDGQGRIVNIQLLLATGTYTRSAGTTTGDIFLIGGPGGGGGAPATAAAQFSTGSGGGSGALTVALNVALPATASITIGAKGSVTIGANGGAGGTTSFTGGALTLTAPGGGGGSALGPSGSVFGVPPGAGAAAGTFTGGSFASGGQEGAFGIGALTTGTQSLRGAGGMSTLWGFGWGGYGNALGPSSSAVAGFQGSTAAIIVFERT